MRVIRSSSLYRTQPVGYAAQPWFFNQVIEVSTDLEPLPLLALIQKVERELGRRAGWKNGPRTIDIDILLAEDRIIQERHLTIPHPRMADRNFVLVPLSEITPHEVHPLLKKKITDLRRQCRDQSKVDKIADRNCRMHFDLPGGSDEQ